MDQSDEEFDDFIESGSYEENREVDYSDEIWNDRSFHVKVRITNRRSLVRSDKRSLTRRKSGNSLLGTTILPSGREKATTGPSSSPRKLNRKNGKPH